MPAPYKLSVDEFPLFIDSLDKNVTNIMTISRSYDLGGLRTDTKLDDSKILTLVNSSFNFSSALDAHNSAVILHPWAKDEEGDASRIAGVWFDSITFINSYGSTVRYTAYMTSMQFYKRDQPNPFTDAVKSAVTDEEYYSNWGYPFLPPAVSFKEIALPLKVEISVSFGSSKSLKKSRNALRKD